MDPIKLPFPVPLEVLFTCDGNRRHDNSLPEPTHDPHKAGLLRCRHIAKTCFRAGCTDVGMWVASIGNWNHRKRPELNRMDELGIWEMTYRLQNLLHPGEEEEIAIRVCGEWRDHVSSRLSDLIDEVEQKTAQYAGVRRLTLLYGHRSINDELVAVRHAARDGVDMRNVTEEDIRVRLPTAHIGGTRPDGKPAAANIGLGVRTGMEVPQTDVPGSFVSYTSDALLCWQREYTVEYHTPTYWPVFSDEELFKAFKVWSQIAPNLRRGK